MAAGARQRWPDAAVPQLHAGHRGPGAGQPARRAGGAAPGVQQRCRLVAAGARRRRGPTGVAAAPGPAPAQPGQRPAVGAAGLRADRPRRHALQPQRQRRRAAHHPCRRPAVAGQRCRHRPRGRGRSGPAHRVPARQRRPHRTGGRLARRRPVAVHRLPLRQRRPPDPGAHAVRRRRGIDHRLPRRWPVDDRACQRTTGRRGGLAGERRRAQQCLGRHAAGRHAGPPELRGARQRIGLHHPGRGRSRCGDRRGRNHRRRPATDRHRRHGAGPQHAGPTRGHLAAHQRSRPQVVDAQRQRCRQPAHQPGRRPGPRRPHRRQRFGGLGSRSCGGRAGIGRSGRRR